MRRDFLLSFIAASFAALLLVGCTGTSYSVQNKAVAPAITTQPANQAVSAGQTATFSVTATGTAPLYYQWQKNSASISGATSASYTTPPTTKTSVAVFGLLP